VQTSPSSIDLDELSDHARGLEASLCVDSLAFFFERAWKVVEPTRGLLPSVAIDGMCAAGQAIGDGRIKRLAVATCPGTSKSIFWSVMFPAWLLLRTSGRARVMVGSYAWAFALRDAMRCRDLVQSEWFRGLVESLGQAWGIREDANQKGDWWTNAMGRRLITSVEGKSTGERCTFQIVDDALSAASTYSLADQAEAIRWVNEVLTSRMEDQRVDPRIVVGQRLCVNDPVGEAVRRGWPYLYLPAVLGPDDEPCELRDDAGELVWRDPRAPGVPIVELLDLPTLDRLRLDLGPTAFAAQYLQKPADDSAALFKRTAWRWYRPDGMSAETAATWRRPAGCDEDSACVDQPEAWDRIVITADLTFGSLTGDYNVVQAWGSRGSGRYLLRQWRKRAGFDAALEAIESMAHAYPGAKICIEKAANGAAVIETISKRVPGVVALRPIGSKAQRHSAAVPTVESGCAFLPVGWSEAGEFVEEMTGTTKHDDQADTAAYAIVELNTKRVGTPAAPLAFRVG